MLNVISILGVNVTNEKEKKVLEYFFDRLKKTKEKTFIITPNPEMLVYSSKHLDYQNKLNNSTISLPDGVGLFFASGFMGKILKERIPGVDFIEKLCRASKEQPLSIGLLGGETGVAERTAERLLQKYPYLDVVFVASEWSERGFNWQLQRETKPNDTQKNAESVFLRKVSRGSAAIDILFVAFGVPKQEEWIFENLDKIPVKAAMGVGGAFDFISGNVLRAPFILRFIGLEWLFRLITQPWRWKRQLALIEFIGLVFKEKFSK